MQKNIKIFQRQKISEKFDLLSKITNVNLQKKIISTILFLSDFSIFCPIFQFFSKFSISCPIFQFVSDFSIFCPIFHVFSDFLIFSDFSIFSDYSIFVRFFIFCPIFQFFVRFFNFFVRFFIFFRIFQYFFDFSRCPSLTLTNSWINLRKKKLKLTRGDLYDSFFDLRSSTVA